MTTLSLHHSNLRIDWPPLAAAHEKHRLDIQATSDNRTGFSMASCLRGYASAKKGVARSLEGERSTIWDLPASRSNSMQPFEMPFAGQQMVFSLSQESGCPGLVAIFDNSSDGRPREPRNCRMERKMAMQIRRSSLVSPPHVDSSSLSIGLLDALVLRLDRPVRPFAEAS